MLYGFSGYTGMGQVTPTAAMAVSTALPSRGVMTTIEPYKAACSRLQSQLAAYDQSDPQKLCAQHFFAGGCAGQYVKVGLSLFHQAFIKELSAFKGDPARASLLLYCTANAASLQSDLSGEQAYGYLVKTYQKVMGQPPLSAEVAAKQVGSQSPGALTTKPGIYGGTKTADAPTAVLPGGPSQTSFQPGYPGSTPSPSAEQEQAITPGYQPTPDPGPSGQQDVVVFPEVPCPEGYFRPDPMGPCVPVNGQVPVVPGEEKKAMWPWVLGGVLVLGVGGYAIYAAGKKKRRR